MKKILCIIFCFVSGLNFTGCSKNSSGVTAVTTGLSFTSEISYQDIGIVCDGVIDEQGKAVFTVIKPEKINGLCYSFSGNSAEISLDGLTYPLSTLPYDNVFTVLNEFFCDLRKNGNDITLSEDNFSYSGECSLGGFVIYLGQSGLPISASVSKKDIEFTFKNATIL